jgi:hypothetical protein
MAITSQAWNVPDMLMLVLRSEEYLSIILPIVTMSNKHRWVYT